MNENKNLNKVIENVVNKFITEEFGSDDTIEITPDMNLGEFSPLEMV